uniref:Uncharacterized protein n=1 Tax=Rhizophora mucronata TaxID=61149 RepID=A0A2P2NQV1_RHIMU
MDITISLYRYIKKIKTLGGCPQTTSATASHPDQAAHKSNTWIVCTKISLKLAALKCLAKLPVGGHNVVASHGPTVAGGHLEREALTVKV